MYVLYQKKLYHGLDGKLSLSTQWLKVAEYKTKKRAKEEIVKFNKIRSKRFWRYEIKII